ncbi:MAG: glycosyltransferase [bacterium]|nr:glycosyltransferase [bacterium]
MKILAITVYAGSEKLVAMTENMLDQFKECVQLADERCTVDVVTVHNGAARHVKNELCGQQVMFGRNQGFAKGVNAAIDSFLRDHDAVLVLNNDLEFPEPGWLEELVRAWSSPYVLSPCTDRTATKEALDDCSRNANPKRVPQVSAFCWLVPARVIRMLRDRWGFPLFDPDFFAYGEDDYTGAILRNRYGAMPFKVVPRSWVKHLKHQTGAEMHLSGGMTKNLKLLKMKMQKNKLK